MVAEDMAPQARAMARQSAVVRHANKRKAKSGEPIPIPIMNLFPEFAEDAEETFQDQIPDELKEEVEDELPPKKSLEDSVYCCWVTPKKKAAETLKSWSATEHKVATREMFVGWNSFVASKPSKKPTSLVFHVPFASLA